MDLSGGERAFLGMGKGVLGLVGIKITLVDLFCLLVSWEPKVPPPKLPPPINKALLRDY